jgi:methylmalonyl-CoA carboxyltransferase small subunit
MVLEAMKMETNITAPIAGRVAALRVAQGDNVQSGQVVVAFE